jgi:acyl-CoA synthetase (AMP-forming)/AMP-acid ligase II
MSSTRSAVPGTFSDTALGHHFAALVKRYGHNIAVVSRQRALTYHTLYKHARQIAYLLVGEQKQERTPVALLLGHDTPAVAALLGAVLSARPYSFLASSSPQTTHEYILQDLGAKIVLTDSAHEQQARALARRLNRWAEITVNP